MYNENNTKPILFSFMGFQNLSTFSPMLFATFFTIYVSTLVANLLIVLLVVNVQSLKSPMYFFLTQLSLSDILLTTNIAPNLLHVLINIESTISLYGCITQFFFCGVSTATECLFLTVMSYDRYLAICKPLHYISIMNRRLQLQFVLLCWFLSSLIVLYLVCLICNLKFCGPYIIDRYFCDISLILELSCSEHTFIDLSLFAVAVLLVLFPFFFILFTYMCILATICQISSKSGKHKAFSTCSSHLIVVSMYYGTLITLYMVPSKGQSYTANKVVSLLYTMGIPLCNPIIYSLRNQEIKTAMKYLYNMYCKRFEL